MSPWATGNGHKHGGRLPLLSTRPSCRSDPGGSICPPHSPRTLFGWLCACTACGQVTVIS